MAPLTDPDSDDLFGDGLFAADNPDLSPCTRALAAGDMSNFLPMPAPPAPPAPEVSTGVLPLPMPATPAPQASMGVAQGLGDGPVPEFTEEQRRGLWRIIQMHWSAGTGLQAADPQQLIQYFLASHSASPAPPAPTAPQPASAAQPPPVPAPVHHAQNLELSARFPPRNNPPPDGEKIGHARDKKLGNIKLYNWYYPTPKRASWVAQMGSAKIQLRYTEKGEFRYGVAFNRQTLEAYIRACPQRGIQPRLWVQNFPAMHADRYPSTLYKQCRAVDCSEGTISSGDFMVSLDEHPDETSNGLYDGFYVAGCFHLYCLEKMIPLGELKTFADVEPDVRVLPLEDKNPWNLDRDATGRDKSVRSLLMPYREWMNDHYDQYVSKGLPVPRTPYPSSDGLFFHLNNSKLREQPPARQKTRDKRNGCDIAKHRGNRRVAAMHKKAAKKKRTRAQVESDDAGSPILDSDVVVVDEPSPKRARTEAHAQSAPAPASAPASEPVANPSPLRRSRRLSNALAGQYVSVSPPSPPPRDDFLPYAGGSATLQAQAYANQGPSIQTGSMPWPLDNVDLTSMGQAEAQALLADTYNASMQQPALASNYDYNAIVQQPAPASTYDYNYIAPAPYNLRDTQARRANAERHASHNYAAGLDCFIDPQILQNAGTAAPAPADAALADASLANDAVTDAAPVDAAPLAPQDEAVAALQSPSRRVTRSMSRTTLATAPASPQDQLQYLPDQGQAPGTLEGTAAEQNPVLSELPAPDGVSFDDFNEIDFEQAFMFPQSQQDNDWAYPPLDPEQVNLDNVDLEFFD